jgi:hypothetical protein
MMVAFTEALLPEKSAVTTFRRPVVVGRKVSPA